MNTVMKTGSGLPSIDIRDGFFDELYNIAVKDRNVVFLTADMGALGLERFKKDLPDQYINVGVAEQNLISIAAGLALSGKKVFVYSIAPFVTQRCYEQIKVDVSCMGLPVTIIGSGPGITYSSDGPTHHATNDMAIMRSLPEMTILNPSDQIMAAQAARLSYRSKGPMYVRIDKGKQPLLYDENTDFSDGMASLKKGRDLMIVSTGLMTHQAFKVAVELASHSIDAGVIDLYRLKPINKGLLLSAIGQISRIAVLEEHSVVGGLGSAVNEILTEKNKVFLIKFIGIPDKYFKGYGDRDWMYSQYGLDVKSVVNTILEWAQNNWSGTERDSPDSDKAYLRLTQEDFARFFGTTVNDLPYACRDLIAATDFRYQRLDAETRDKVLLDVSKNIDAGQLSVVGRERKIIWEKGWSENLQNFLQNNYDLDELTPKYYRPTQFLRIYRDYAEACNPNFEFSFFKVFRLWIFMKYLKEAGAIYEFGCGPGHNLAALAELYPEKEMHGLDWAQASRDLVNKIAEVRGYNITGHLFDMFSPDKDLKIKRNSAILTIGSLEQLGGDFEPFMKFLLNKPFGLCINIEPMCELYDEGSLLDYLALKYQGKRKYLSNYLSYLKRLADMGEIEILKTQRMFFGNLYYDGWSFVVWKPKNK